jgi:hypothetical protein
VYRAKILLFSARSIHTVPEIRYGNVRTITKLHQLIHAGLVAFVLLPCGVTAIAQTIAPATIKGRVVDARTGAGLARVSVSVAGSAVEKLTDAEGGFVLTGIVPGTVRLIVSVVGYILVQREVPVGPGETHTLTIPLTEGTGTYTETVTVTSAVFPAIQPGVASQQVLGSADIQNLRGVLADDPLRAVQVLPGVATGDDLRSEFSVRGSDFSRMNFTVEGFATPFLLHTVRAIEDRANSGSVAMINSDILENVALLNGGYPQQHGNRTGAEIDFRLREGARDRPGLRVGVSGTNASAVVEGPLGGTRRGSWLVSARKSYLDLLVRRLGEDGLAFGFSDVQGKIVFDVTPRQSVEFAVVAGRSKLRDVDVDDPSDVFTGRNSSAVAVAGWRLSGRRGLLAARALGAQNSFRNNQTDSRDIDQGDTTQLAARVDGTLVARSGLEVDGGVQVERSHEWRIRHRTSGGFRVVNDYDGSAVREGGYAQVRWTPLAALTLIPGVRGDHSSLTGEATVSPWIAGEWRLPGGLAARGGAGVYRQFPDFEQVIGMLGRLTNTHERAVQVDLGLEGRVGATGRWQVTLYDREEQDMMRRLGAETRLVNGRVVRGSISTPYLNRLDGYARGVEFLLQRRTPNGLSGWVAYAYGRNRYEDRLTAETFWGDLDQRHTLNVHGFYRLSDRTSVSGKFRLGSNFPAPGYYGETEDGRYVLVDTRNGLRLPIYARLDIRANRTFTWSRRRLTLFVEVMNVLNRDNVRMGIPRVNSVTHGVTRLFEEMIPIVPSAGVLIEF